jgi:hypothetical protein
MAKEKTTKKKKIILLSIVFGVIVLISIIYNYIVIPITQNIFFSKFPEIKVVTEAVQDAYPNGNVMINSRWFKSAEDGKTTTILSVIYDSKDGLSESDIEKMGDIVCAEIKKINKSYDHVEIVEQHSVRLPFFNYSNNEAHNIDCN